MMTTVSRQASSSLYGLAPALEDILDGKLARLESEDDDDAAEERNDYQLDAIRGDIESLVQRAHRLDPADPKADTFTKVIADKLAMPKNKVLVFSTFRHTLNYLAEKLAHRASDSVWFMEECPTKNGASFAGASRCPKRGAICTRRAAVVGGWM